LGSAVLTWNWGAWVSSTESEKRVEQDRILPRHQFEARVKIEIRREHKSVSIEGWARDLSEGGLGAFVGAALVIGELATLRIPLSDEFELIVPAIVIRNVGTQYGFRFTALSGKQRDQLRKTLGRCTPVPYQPEQD
jgi:PilZ domain